jgi:hypothetical protein
VDRGHFHQNLGRGVSENRLELKFLYEAQFSRVLTLLLATLVRTKPDGGAARRWPRTRRFLLRLSCADPCWTPVVAAAVGVVFGVEALGEDAFEDLAVGHYALLRPGEFGSGHGGVILQHLKRWLSLRVDCDGLAVENERERLLQQIGAMPTA